MSVLGDLAAFASVTETLAKDPFQLADAAGKDDWNFQLKTKPSQPANLYDRIPELARNEYGLENLHDLYNAYRRTEHGLPPVEEEKSDLEKTVTICGLEIKYAKPSGIPESDSEVTDSDFESDFENSTATEHDAEGSDDFLSEAVASMTYAGPAENAEDASAQDADKVIDSESMHLSEQQPELRGEDIQLLGNVYTNIQEADESIDQGEDTQLLGNVDANIQEADESIDQGEDIQLLGNVDANIQRADESIDQCEDIQLLGNVDANIQKADESMDQGHDDAENIQETDTNSDLVYGYASTVSPGSRRVSRVSMVGIARSRRCSIDTGVQPDVVAKEVVPNASELREARRKSSAGMHQRRKSVMFSTDGILGFQEATRSRNEVFACQVAGRKFELVVDECPLTVDGIAGVQCSAAEIDATMDVLFADLPLMVEEPAKAKKVDVAVQWTGGDELVSPEPVVFEGDMKTPERQPQPQAPNRSSNPVRPIPSARLSRKSAPANLGIRDQTSLRDGDAEDGASNYAQNASDETMGEHIDDSAEIQGVCPPLVEETISAAGHDASSHISLSDREAEIRVVDIDGLEIHEVDMGPMAVSRQSERPNGKISQTQKTADTVAFDAEPDGAYTQPSDGAAPVPVVCLDDDDDDDDDDLDVDGHSFGGEPDDSRGEADEMLDVELASLSFPETKEMVDIASSAARQRATIVIGGGVDIQPEKVPAIKAETVSKGNKKRKRGKQSRHTASGTGKKAARATGSRKKAGSHRELKRLGLTSVHVPQSDDGQDGEVDASQPRRSKRRKFPPLQYWKNEKKVYERRMSQLLPTISQVVVAVEQDSEDERDVNWGNIKSRGVINSRR